MSIVHNEFIDPQSTLESLQWRYAVKAYDATRRLSAEQVSLIKDSLRLAPSSFGLQGWKFVHVATPEVREQLRLVGYNQPQFTDASDVFVLASYQAVDAALVDRFIQSTATTRKVSVESLQGYQQLITGFAQSKSADELEQWLARQVYIALGTAMAVAAIHRIDTTPLEGFDPDKVSQLLGLTDKGLKARVILTAGFRSADDAYQTQQKVRFDESEVFIKA